MKFPIGSIVTMLDGIDQEVICVITDHANGLYNLRQDNGYIWTGIYPHYIVGYYSHVVIEECVDELVGI